MLLIKSRRSNRTLTSRPVPKEMLDKIVEAAHSAPTATNSQSLSFTVVTDPQKLRQVRDYTIYPYAPAVIKSNIVIRLIIIFLRILIRPPLSVKSYKKDSARRLFISQEHCVVIFHDIKNLRKQQPPGKKCRAVLVYTIYPESKYSMQLFLIRVADYRLLFTHCCFTRNKQ